MRSELSVQKVGFQTLLHTITSKPARAFTKQSKIVQELLPNLKKKAAGLNVQQKCSNLFQAAEIPSQVLNAAAKPVQAQTLSILH